MPTPLKVAVMFGAAWLGPLLLALVFTGIAAGATLSWPPSRLHGVVLGTLFMDVVLMGVGSFLLWRGMSAQMPATTPRVLTLLGHVALQLATLAMMVMVNLLAFNR